MIKNEKRVYDESSCSKNIFPTIYLPSPRDKNQPVFFRQFLQRLKMYEKFGTVDDAFQMELVLCAEKWNPYFRVFRAGRVCVVERF